MSDTHPITRLEELDKHIDELNSNPDTPLDAALFDHVELQLTEANTPRLIPSLLPRLASVLKTYRAGDPAALCSLALKLLQPTTFQQVMSITSEDELVQALRSPVPSANVLGMAILHKAAASPADVAVLSASTPLVTELLVGWLSAPQVEVGEKGARTLIDLLETDCELPAPPPPSRDPAAPQQQLARRRSPGHGKMWRRLLGDRAVFGLLIDLCEGRRRQVDVVDSVQDDEENDEDDNTKQRSLAQGRLLRILPRLVMIDFAALARCDFPDLLPRHSHAGRPDNVLRYAAVRMVDRSDPLLRMLLVDFLETLVCATRLAEPSALMTETLRGLLREVAALDNSLTASLPTLPDRVDPDEAPALRRWIHELMPPPATRVG